ncbi:Uncharacterised protein [Bordetella pertussis]|nr:Uncharacterised protein [Bordetella pertussis]
MVLGPAQDLHALALAGAALIDLMRHRGRSDKRDRLDIGVVDQGIDRLHAALHHARHARRQARLAQHLGQRQRRRCVQRAGLEHERVAGGQRHRHHPQRNHHREIERRDAGHHAERFALHPVIDPPAHVDGHRPFHEFGRAAGEFDHFDPAHDFAARIRDHLAVLARNHARQRLLVVFQQGQEAVEHPRPMQRALGRPGRLRGTGRRDGLRHRVAAAQPHLRRHLAGGRIINVLQAMFGAIRGLSADPMRHLRGLIRHASLPLRKKPQSRQDTPPQ